MSFSPSYSIRTGRKPEIRTPDRYQSGNATPNSNTAKIPFSLSDTNLDTFTLKSLEAKSEGGFRRSFSGLLSILSSSEGPSDTEQAPPENKKSQTTGSLTPTRKLTRPNLAAPQKNRPIHQAAQPFIMPEEVEAGIQQIEKLAYSSRSTEQIAERLETLKSDAILSFKQQGQLYQAMENHLSTVKRSLRLGQLDSAQKTLAPYLRHFKPRATQFSKSGASYVRSAKELTASDIKMALKGDMQTITPAFVEQVLNDLPPDINPALAHQVFQHMIQWSNPDSLQGMAEALKKLQHEKPLQGRKILTCGEASLSDSLRYLVGNNIKPKPLNQFEKLFDNSKTTFETPGSNNAILLDQYILQRLEDNPELFRTLMERTKNITLLAPRGWNAGANLFNLHDPVSIRKKLETLCRQVEHLESEGKDRQTAIEQALEQPVREQLIALFKKHDPKTFNFYQVRGGLTDAEALNQILSAKRLHFFNSSHFQPIDSPNLEQIQKQLKQGPRVKKKNIEQILEQLPNDQRQPFLELLGQGLQLYSPRRMSVDFRKLHQKLTVMAAQKGIEPEQIYFYIPQNAGNSKNSIKSHTLVTNQYCEVNQIPAKQVLTDYRQMPTDKKTMLVILDDFSGSGHSLAAVAKRIQEAEPTGREGTLQVVIAPNVASEESVKLLTEGGEFNMPRSVPGSGKAKSKWRSSLENYEPSPFIQMVPGSISPNLRSLPYYQNLSHKDKRVFDDLMGENGYVNCSTFTGFWWMSPTNNIRSEVAKQVLELNILNGVGYR